MRKSLKKHIFILFFFTIIVTFFCSKMSPFYPIQEWSDVNLYFNIGKAIMNGQVLYVNVFDHKGPLIFLIYGIGYLISNNTFLGVFLLECATWIMISYFGYKIALLQFSSKISLLISCVFLTMFISHTSQGGSAEEFIACCMMISLYLFVRFFQYSDDLKKRQKKDYFIHGLLFGIVFLIKFNLCVFWFFPFFVPFFTHLQHSKLKFCLELLISFLTGLVIILIPVILYFVFNDGIHQALESYIFVNANQGLDFLESIHRVSISFYQRLRFEFLEFCIILLGAFIYPFLMFKNIVARLSIPLAFFVLFFSIFVGGYVYYYSIPYYIFIALGLVVICSIINRFICIEKLQYWILYLMMFFILCMAVYRKHLFSNADFDDKNNVITTFLPHIKNEEDRTLINLSLDESNALFTYANIMPNVKYFIAPNLSDDRFPELREEQASYIKDGKINFVILAEYTNNAYFFDQYEPLKNNYEVVATYEEYYKWQNVNRKIYLYKRITNDKK